MIGVVDEPRRYSDLRSFLDDFYDRQLEAELIAEPPPTSGRRSSSSRSTCSRTRHLRDDVDSHRPPIAGPVYFATQEAIEYALDRHEFSGTPIPALLHTNGNAERTPTARRSSTTEGNVVFQRAPIWLDEDYLLGPEAGHANWTGQSGLATKTSHAHVPDQRGLSANAGRGQVGRGPDVQRQGARPSLARQTGRSRFENWRLLTPPPTASPLDR